MIESEELKVYSEDHLLYGHVVQKHTLSAVEQIKDKIRDEGNRGTQGFFYAIIPKNGNSKKDGVNVVEIKINTKKIQPIDGWWKTFVCYNSF